MYCLDSIPLRDDVQVIVVDDNSDSRIVDFNSFPNWEGKHFEYYFTKEGGGAGYARNIGLKHALGEWVLFADADDYFTERANTIFDFVLQKNADVVYTKARGVMLFDRATPSERAKYINQLIDEYLYSNNETNIRTTFWGPVCKFVKRSFIRRNNVWFDEIPYSNDLYFSTKIGCAADSISAIDGCLYCITESDHSLTSNFGKKEGEKKSRAIGLFHSEIVTAKYRYTDLNCIIYQLREWYINDLPLFIVGVACMVKEGYRLSYVIRRVFATRKFSSRIKHSFCAFVIIVLHLISIRSLSYKHAIINNSLIQNACSHRIIRL
jgi:glycosyltransferase involved in cell wall biosynthesis